MMVNLSNTSIGDAGLAHLKDCTEIQNLFLNQTKVTDQGLANVKDFTKLLSLHLEDTAVTDEGMKHLVGLTRLRNMNLSRTKVTSTEVASLERSIPGLKVFRNDGAPPPPIRPRPPRKPVPPSKSEDGSEGLVKTSSKLSGKIASVVFSADGKKLYAATEAATIHIFDAMTLEESEPIKVLGGKILKMVHSPGASAAGMPIPPRLYALDDEKKVHVFDTEKGASIRDIRLESYRPRINNPTLLSIALSPDGNTLIVTSRFSFVPIFIDTRKWGDAAPPRGLKDEKLQIAVYSPDGKIGAICRHFQDVIVFNIPKNANLMPPIAQKQVSRLELVPEANLVLMEDNWRYRAVNYSTKNEAWNEKLHDQFNYYLAPIPKAAQFVTAGHNAIRVWDAAGPTQVAQWGFNGLANGVVVSPDGKYAATWHWPNDDVRLWALPAGGKNKQ
jgi:WD40 repeat protein